MNESLVRNEIKYKAVRSGGPGGQHANKVSSKVVAQFDLWGSGALSEAEKLLIEDKLKPRITEEGYLILSCDTTRSQHKNKVLVAERMLSLLAGALKKKPRRIPTKVSKAARKRRAQKKMRHAEKKALRRKPDLG